MGKAQLCPVCKGEGKRKGKTCHGCGGKGWVIVPGSYYPPPLVPPNPYEPPWTTPWRPGDYPRRPPGTGDYDKMIDGLTMIMEFYRAKEELE